MRHTRSADHAPSAALPHLRFRPPACRRAGRLGQLEITDGDLDGPSAAAHGIDAEREDLCKLPQAHALLTLKHGLHMAECEGLDAQDVRQLGAQHSSAGGACPVDQLLQHLSALRAGRLQAVQLLLG